MESGTQLGKAMGQTQGSGEVTESLHLVHSPKTRTSRVARTARQPWPGHSIRVERVALQQDLILPLPAYTRRILLVLTEQVFLPVRMIWLMHNAYIHPRGQRVVCFPLWWGLSLLQRLLKPWWVWVMRGNSRMSGKSISTHSGHSRL